MPDPEMICYVALGLYAFISVLQCVAFVLWSPFDLLIPPPSPSLNEIQARQRQELEAAWSRDRALRNA